VPAECLVIDADLFVRVGGFNDRALPTAFYDLDLCFRLLDRGLLNVYSPSPSITCAPRAGAPSKHEIAFVWERWPERLGWLLSYQPSEVDLVRPDRVERAMRVAGNGSAPAGSPQIS
jgi:hypothetical protein